MYKKYLALITLFLVFWQQPASAYVIRGQIDLGEDWERKIYLSAIPTIEDMNTASEEFMVEVARVGEGGQFVFQGDNLLVPDRLYRLHVCKKGDPPATLFIGGKEENHFHFVMNNGSQLIFSSDELFKNAKITGHPAGPLLQEFNNKIDQLYRPLRVNSRINRERRLQQLKAFVYQFADTCSQPIPAILAIERLNLEELCLRSPDFIRQKLDDWSLADTHSPYLLELRNKVKVYISISDTSSKRKWLIAGFTTLLIIAGFFFFRKNIPDKKSAANPSTFLSGQEHRVLQLLSGGKSNKEISEALHIEVSTVKSHVSSIYAKLGVKSRKEVIGKY